jgi:D-lactate dehydrogenase
LVSLDIALPRNCEEWVEHLPDDLANALPLRIHYGHFFCHVFHQDYVAAPGQDIERLKTQLLAICADRGARYPAEHNFGHEYTAPSEVQTHYHDLDPDNVFNPGIGGTSKLSRQHAR